MSPELHGLRMHGGHIAGDLIGAEGMQGFIAGGSLDGDLRASFGGVFDIYGGQFGGGDPDSLWRLGGTQVMNVYGWNLMVNDARLTGSSARWFTSGRQRSFFTDLQRRVES